MEKNRNKNLLKELLDRLQEDSWQLELLVSGFTIFGLFYALDPVGNIFDKAIFNDELLKDVYQAVYVAIRILIFNLIIHVVLRSLWIGALGLRYISGDVDIEKLNYSERFTNYLNRKIGSFDTYIERLEKLCSTIFAISFLLIFYFAAILIIQHSINIVGLLEPNNASVLVKIVIATIQILLAVGAILTFIDYLTQGVLKKNKWVATIYFPFYWIFSYLTLSFLYRPLYYNLIDNKFGRRISFMLIPFYLSVLFISNIYEEESGFINLDSVASNAIRANNQNYEDLVEKNDLFISTLTIQSKVISDPFLRINIPISDAIEKRIMKFNHKLSLLYDKQHYKSHMDINGNSLSSTFIGDVDSLHQEFIKTFQNIYSIKIDSISYNTDFVIYKGDNGMNRKIGFESYIGTRNLQEGKHILVYSRLKHPDTDSVITIKEIPFWYYKD